MSIFPVKKAERENSLLQLIESTRSEGIRADQTCSESFPLIMDGQLRGARGVSISLRCDIYRLGRLTFVHVVVLPAP